MQAHHNVFVFMIRVPCIFFNNIFIIYYQGVYKNSFFVLLALLYYDEINKKKKGEPQTLHRNPIPIINSGSSNK